MYGEESRNPKKIIPQATMIAVLGVGIFYVFVSWMAHRGHRPADRRSPLPRTLHRRSTCSSARSEQYLGHWAVVLFQFLLMTGSLACAMAFHNCASRYIYAIAREDLLPGMARTIGRDPPQARLALRRRLPADGDRRRDHLLCLLHAAATPTPSSTASWRSSAPPRSSSSRCSRPSRASPTSTSTAAPDDGHWFRTFAAPLIGGIGMAYAVFLLLDNANFVAGAPPTTSSSSSSRGSSAWSGSAACLRPRREAVLPGALRHHRPGRAGRAASASPERRPLHRRP